ncbi:hypothetical protein [Corallococcus macrosporus]|uniref:Uncharacterized protein n=1 Tax=Myxococcus fulvus (strain ATCC BAA-855 / HW-1) TaxID=483219 RepID=F8CC36_MYXFH|nr:hypothetical protein [Corallococcus macrosporus]AEI67193.1 hypothetical protein LILAB_26505 [Corallococcus macrosporus]
MQFLLRLLAVLLVLTTGGVFQTLALASDVHDECAEEASDDCADCSTTCVLCVCCPLRAAPGPSITVARLLLPSLRLPLPSRVAEPLLTGVGADIFQPPRA